MNAAPGGQGLLDTNAVILLSQLRDPSVLPGEPVISTVTLAELSVGPLLARSEPERAARQAHLQQAEADFDPLPLPQPPRGRSAGSPHPCAAPVARPRLGPMTR